MVVAPRERVVPALARVRALVHRVFPSLAPAPRAVGHVVLVARMPQIAAAPRLLPGVFAVVARRLEVSARALARVADGARAAAYAEQVAGRERGGEVCRAEPVPRLWSYGRMTTREDRSPIRGGDDPAGGVEPREPCRLRSFVANRTNVSRRNARWCVERDDARSGARASGEGGDASLVLSARPRRASVFPADLTRRRRITLARASARGNVSARKGGLPSRPPRRACEQNRHRR